MQEYRRSMRIARFLAVAAGALTVAATGIDGARAAQPPYKMLFNFDSSSDGNQPNNPLTADQAGSLYGTTSYGGASNQGVVFKITRGGRYKILYSFTGGKDGAQPQTLAVDQSGTLYGTTFAGGSTGNGVVYSLSPTGQETVLHSFAGGAKDGAQPIGALLLDSSGTLLGTTQSGGANDAGVVFAVKQGSHEQILHVFGGAGDGASPEGGVIEDAKGNLYGTTLRGGAGSVGTLFEITASGAESVLYSFQNGLDGGLPASGLLLDSSGNLYGTTLNGGSGKMFAGVLFKFAPNGSESVIYSFTGEADGGTPYATPIQDAVGNFYGTTANGGSLNVGVIFKVTPDGKERVLHDFTSGEAGGTPRCGLARATAAGRTLFGIASDADNGPDAPFGTIFSIKEGAGLDKG